MTGIPSAVTDEQVDILQEYARDKRVLEIGSLLGRSTIALAAVAEYVVSIDPHEGYPPDDPRPTLNPFLNNLRQSGLREKVRVCVGSFRDFVALFQDELFDLIFIDADGTFTTTRSALEWTRECLKYGGHFIVHDMNHPKWTGATLAAERFAGGWNYDLSIGSGLGIITRT